MDTWKGAAVGHLIVEGQHTVCWKGAWVDRRVKARVHGTIVVHCGAKQVRAAWQRADLLRVQSLRMANGGFAGLRQVSVTVGPQSFHDGKEVQPSTRPPSQVEMSDGPLRDS